MRKGSQGIVPCEPFHITILLRGRIMLIINFLCLYLKRHKQKVLIYTFVTCLLWGISVFTPFIMGIYIDVLVAKQPLKLVMYFIVAVAAIEILHIFAQYLGTYSATQLNNVFLYDITNDIFQKIFSSKLSEFKKIDSAYLIDQITTDAANIVSFFSGNITNIFLQALTIIVSSFIVLKSDVLISILIFSLLPIYVISYIACRSRLYAANLKFKEETNEYYSKKVEQINKLEFIKRNVVYEEMEIRFNKAFRTMYKVAISQVKTNYIFSNLNQIMFVICYISVIAIGGYKVLTGKMTVGFLTIISTYFSMIISSATYFLNLAGNYQETKISVERINKIKNAEREIFGEIHLNSINKIQVKDFSIKYEEKVVINNLNVELEKGKIYAIVGANGAGKTTLVNSIVGLYSDLYEGEILFDGIPIKKLDMPYLRRNCINYVEQEPSFLSLSLDEYLQFGIERRDAIEKRKKQLMALLNIKKCISEKSGEQKIIQENGSNFSGGEKQKLALVRGLCKESILTIMDEPTSALDTKSVNSLLEWIKNGKQKEITLIITHDERVIKICDEIINL